MFPNNMFPNNMFPNNMFPGNMFASNMFPSNVFPIQPPNSRCSSPVDEIRVPHCLQKTEKPVEETQVTFSTTIDALPDEIFLYIFKFLSIDEKLQTRLVCSKWQQLIKSDVLWKNVFIRSSSPLYLMGCLLSLPPCVHYLEIESYGESVPLSFPEFMYKIHERCPHLKSLELINVNFKKNLLKLDESYNEESDSLNDQSIEESDSLDNESIQECDSLNNGSDRKRIPKFISEIIPSRKQIRMQARLLSKFVKEEDVAPLNAALLELRVLSLTQVLFNHVQFSAYSTFIPKIVVLNLSYCILSFPDLQDDLFSTLTELEELYLEGCYIKDEILQNVLQNSKKLRILDLESSSADNNTIEICKQYGVSLEELFLAHTGIGDICKTAKDEIFFPRLQSLCVKYSNVTQKGIVELLLACPSLKCVNASFCQNLSRTWYNEVLPKELKERVIFVENANYYNRYTLGCSHFYKSNFDILSM